jgi:hypothetical protein
MLAKMRRLLLLFAPLLSVGACNGDSFDNDAGADSGSDGIVVGGGDGATDGAASDGDAIAPKPRFCASIDAQFCADFDDPNDAGAGFFMPPTTTNGYQLSFETSQAKSTPTGVEVFLPGDAGGTAKISAALGIQGDGGASTSATLDMDMFVPNFSGVTTQPLFLFAFGAVAPTYQYALAHDGSSWKLEFISTKNGPTLNGNFALNEWVHVSLVIVTDNTAGYASLTITSSAGTATAAFPPGQLPVVPQNAPPPYPILFDVGVASISPIQNTAQVYYDNVVVHLQ